MLLRRSLALYECFLFVNILRFSSVVRTKIIRMIKLAFREVIRDVISRVFNLSG